MSEARSQQSEVRGQGSSRGTRAFFVAWCICLLSSVFCPLIQADEFKIGYVNLLKVFDGYQRTADSKAVLEQKGKQKQAELEGRFNELKKLRENLELLNDQAKDAKAREVEERSDEFKRLKTRSERELLREQNQLAKQILDEIDAAVADYAKGNGFSVILDDLSLVYGQSASDVTEAVLKVLTQRYAGKAAKKP